MREPVDEFEEYLYSKTITELTAEEIEYIEDETDWFELPELFPKEKKTWCQRNAGKLFWHIYGLIYGFGLAYIYFEVL